MQGFGRKCTKNLYFCGNPYVKDRLTYEKAELRDGSSANSLFYNESGTANLAVPHIWLW